jgi:DNA-directed RNA polymerase specialized sigma24 family protein
MRQRPARIVELRFFNGLSVEETAAVLDVSERTVKREWQKARAFLFDALQRRRIPLAILPVWPLPRSVSV